jgi:uncharacterized Zn-finger protein
MDCICVNKTKIGHGNVYLMIDEGKIKIISNHSIRLIKINYCPYCGSKL